MLSSRFALLTLSPRKALSPRNQGKLSLVSAHPTRLALGAHVLRDQGKRSSRGLGWTWRGKRSGGLGSTLEGGLLALMGSSVFVVSHGLRGSWLGVLGGLSVGLAPSLAAPVIGSKASASSSAAWAQVVLSESGVVLGTACGGAGLVRWTRWLSGLLVFKS